MRGASWSRSCLRQDWPRGGVGQGAAMTWRTRPSTIGPLPDEIRGRRRPVRRGQHPPGRMAGLSRTAANETTTETSRGPLPHRVSPPRVTFAIIAVQVFSRRTRWSQSGRWVGAQAWVDCKFAYGRIVAAWMRRRNPGGASDQQACGERRADLFCTTAMSLRAITAPAPCGIGWSRHLGHVGSEREDGCHGRPDAGVRRPRDAQPLGDPGAAGALTRPRPRQRYPVGRTPRIAAMVASLPERLRGEAILRAGHGSV
jgi:hypothetical protein